MGINKKVAIGSTVAGIAIAVGLVAGIESIGLSDAEKAKYVNYTADNKYMDGTVCVAQTDESLKTIPARKSTGMQITMVEAKYFAITEKYNCKLIYVNGIDTFEFKIRTPHKHWMQFEVDALNMADGFADVSDKFDVDKWVKTGGGHDKKHCYDLPDDEGLREDGQFYKDTLKKISEELAKAENEPDIGLISLQFLGIYCDVDNAKLSYDVKNLLSNIGASESATISDISDHQQNS